MIASVIKKEIFINPSSGVPYTQYTDQTDYTVYGLVTANIKGNFTITAPSVGVIHSGTSWVTPDINLSVSNVFQQSPLPLDNDGIPFVGEYSHQYNIQVTRAVSAANTVGNYFEIAGDFTSITPSSGIITIAGSASNNGDYTIVSISLQGGNTRFVVLEPIPTNTVDGNLSFYLSFAQDSYDFFWCSPTVDLDTIYNCILPSISTTDSTDYNITYVGEYTALPPSSLSRVLTLNYPRGIIPTPTPIPPTSAQTLTWNILYTKTWAATLETNLIYELPSGFIANYTARGSQETEVTCSQDLCDIRQCIDNAIDEYFEAYCTNAINLQRKKQVYDGVIGNYVKYQAALNCGDTEAQSEALNALKAQASLSDCGCGNSNNSTSPQRISGYGGGAASGNTYIVTTTSNGIVVTANTVGTTTTYTLSIDYSIVVANVKASNSEEIAGAITTKLSTPGGRTAWFLALIAALGNNRVLTTNGSGVLIGAVQNTAFNKNFGINAGDVPEIASTLGVSQSVFTDGSGKLITAASTNNYRLLHNNNTDVSNSTDSPVNLMSYTLPLNTISTNDSLLVVTAEVNFTTTSTIDPDCNINLYFGTYQFNIVQTYLAGQVIVVLEISRLAVNSQRIRAIVYQNGSPVATYTPALTTTNQDFANNIVIRIEGNKTPASGFTTTVTAKTLRVEAKIK